MKPIFSILYLFICPAALCIEINNYTALDYLMKYGYLQKNTLSVDISVGLRSFQETFKLNVTGKLDDETVSLMKKPRCGLEDEIRPMSYVSSRKFPTTQITWNVIGKKYIIDVVEQAFKAWSEPTGLVFKRSTAPMIFVSMSEKSHMKYSTEEICSFNFDGLGGVLAHAFYPYTNVTDIHIDQEENWDYSFIIPPDGDENDSLFMTVVHEIGHALGLDHVIELDSIMFPFVKNYKKNTSIFDFKLDKHSVNSIKKLYGTEPSTTTTESSQNKRVTTPKNQQPPPPSPSPTPSVVTDDDDDDDDNNDDENDDDDKKNKSFSLEKCFDVYEDKEKEYDEKDYNPASLTMKKNVCEVKNKRNQYLVVDNKIYIISDEHLWIMNLDPRKRTPDSYFNIWKIWDWLRDVKEKKISAVYQKPNDEITIFINNTMYNLRLPSMNIVSRDSLPMNIHINFINGAVITNRGKTYVFFNHLGVYSIRQGNRPIFTFLGITSNVFPGVPNIFNSVFRYTNGMLYFVTDDVLFEYDEYFRRVNRTWAHAFDLLNIDCTDTKDLLVRKLKELISKLNL